VSHFPYGPTAYFSLHNVVLRHDIPDRGTVSEQYPHLIFEAFTSRLGERVCRPCSLSHTCTCALCVAPNARSGALAANQTKSILRYLFPVPKEDSRRVMTFANTNDFISFRCAGTPTRAHSETRVGGGSPAASTGITCTSGQGPSRLS
jgi:U3 small nucleolar ribonucleoprotein protein IMP4